MMSPVRITCFAIILLMVAVTSFVHAQTTGRQETLNQYVADLQKNPNDNAMREKIIKLAQEMKPAPAIPEEARRHYVMALTLFKGAKKIEDYGESIDEFKSALLVAPWWAEANRDLGMALEAAKRYDDAISALKLYIASSLGEEKARAAQDEIYKIEAMKKLTAREKAESAPQAVATQKQNTFDDLLRKIDGRRYTEAGGREIKSVLDVRGRLVVRGYIENGRYNEWDGDAARIEIKGRETTVPIRDQPAFLKVKAVSMDVIIGEDGDKINMRTHFSDGDVREYMHFWQR